MDAITNKLYEIRKRRLDSLREKYKNSKMMTKLIECAEANLEKSLSKQGSDK